ncbi:MAG: hypothetical protein BGO78_01550 [Chloroflexi bacterium 44-23]|nr:MAG: hypothetical protein BGO78_01550 [Chloroflexi bacterium 44-23]
MNLKQQLSETLKKAMKENDADTKRVVRLIMAAIKNSEIDNNAELSEQEIISILQKEIKVRQESIEGAQKNQRQDLIKQYEQEMAFINQFLPKQLTETELRNIIIETMAEINATGISDMGKVMKELIPRIAGRAPGNVVSQLVKEILSNK